jgi:hypothetical protein
MKRYIIFCFVQVLLVKTSICQNRFGVYISAVNSSLLNNTPSYSSQAFNTISKLSDREPLYKDLLLTNPMWNYNSFGVYARIKKYKRFSFFGTTGKTVLGHKTYYYGGKSENYPFLLMAPFATGQDLSIENTVTLHLFTAGINTNFKINQFCSFELSANYSFAPKKDARIFRSSFSKVISSPNFQQGAKDLYYIDVNEDGIVHGTVGLNTNLSNKLRLHVLYLRTINGVNKYKEFMPFKYRQQYRGIALQLSYCFFNQNKND